MHNQITGHIDRAVLYTGIDDRPFLSVEGWIVHPKHRIKSLKIGFPGQDLCKTKWARRPDVGKRLWHIPYAKDSGFTANIPIKNSSTKSTEIILHGNFDDDRAFVTSFFVTPQIPNFNTTTLGEVDVTEQLLGSRKSRMALLSQFEIAFRCFLKTSERIIFAQPKVKRVSVILVLHNQAALTYNCLVSLKLQESAGLEIIIIDNCSSDETNALLERIDGAKIIRNKENRHFIAGANQGASVAKGDYLLFLNNDTVLYPGAIDAALQAVSKEPSVGVVGGRLIRPDGLLQEAGSYVLADGSTQGIGVGQDPFNPKYCRQFEVDYVSGAFFFTPRTVFEALEGFDNSYAPAYYEDADYCFRVRENDLRVIYVPEVTLLHLQHGSSSDYTEAFSLIEINQPLFLERHKIGRTNISAMTSDKSTDDELTRDRRILFIDDFIPDGSKGQGLPRAVHILHALNDMGYIITVLPTNESDETSQYIRRNLPEKCLFYIETDPTLIDSAIARVISSHGKVYVSRPHNMERVSRVLAAMPKPHPFIIYDAEAIFALREIRKSELVTGNKFLEDDKRKIIEQEVKIADGANLVVCVSDNEASHFAPNKKIGTKVLSHMVNTQEYITPFENRSGFLTVGPLLDTDTPNSDALIWFMENVFPELQKDLPRALAHVTAVGKNLLAKSIIDKFTGVNLPGIKSSLVQDYNSHKIFFAAHRFSAGIPLKIIEAASYGIPVISTPLLASQLGWSNSELYIAETPKEWREGCIELSTNKEKWNALSNNALIKVKESFSKEVFYRALTSVLDNEFLG